jgi:gamma-glutamylcyclotransferase
LEVVTVIHYFAYGSNMLIERLQRRCPSAKAVGIGYVDRWGVKFSKIGRDDSGKATLYPMTNTRSYGVVFTLNDNDLTLLDQFEGAGHGYDRVNDFKVQLLTQDEPLKAVTYIAPVQFQSEAIKPFDWYVGLVMAGAEQHCLPADYIVSLQSVPSIQDPDTQRQTRLEAIQLLQHIKTAQS